MYTQTHMYIHARVQTVYTQTHTYLPVIFQLLLVLSLLQSMLSPLHTGSSVHEQTQYKLLPPPKCGKTPQTASHFSLSYCQLECDSSGVESSLPQSPASHILQWLSWQTTLAGCSQRWPLSQLWRNSSEWSHEPHYLSLQGLFAWMYVLTFSIDNSLQLEMIQHFNVNSKWKE